MTTLRIETAEQMRSLGARLGDTLVAGDLVLLTGELGAGKTTLASGIGAGLGVRGPVTSPTFVIAREHPSVRGGPGLVHVDAYRLGGFAELEDLDLQTALEESVTLVEWGHGLAEGLAEERLEVLIERSGSAEDETRLVRLVAVGKRWAAPALDWVEALDLAALDGAALDGAESLDDAWSPDSAARNGAARPARGDDAFPSGS